MFANMNARIVVGALVVGAAIVAFLTWRGHLDATGATLTALFGSVAVFLRPEKGDARSPRDTQSGERAPWPAGGPAEEKPTVEETPEQRARRLKTDLLIAWAKNGETIDSVTELKAQLYVDEIRERGARWLNPSDLPDPNANGEGPTEH